MPVTVAQLYNELRLGSEADTIPADVMSILARLIAVATARVEKFASAAPDIIKHRAIVLYAGYLYDSNSLGPPPSNAFRRSGAFDCLKEWKATGLGVISREDDDDV